MAAVVSPLVREIMTAAPYSIAASTELDGAMRVMDQRDLRHLPVVEARTDESGKEGQPPAVVGMLSDRELLSATGWLPADDRRERMEPSGEGKPRTVADIMRTPAPILAPDDRIFDLALWIVTERISGAAVVEDGALVGVVTEADLLRVYGEVCASDPDFHREGDLVGRVMTASPRVAKWDTTLKEAWEAMTDAAVRHLPVVAAGEVIGIVSDRDLRRAWGRGRHADEPIELVMSADVATIEPDVSLCAAAKKLGLRAVSCLPVVTDGTLVGVITTVDVACHCMERFGHAG